MSDSPRTRFDRVTATKFATIHVIWSLCWVLGSDYLTHITLHGPAVEWKAQSYKGCIYVLVSGCILFLAIRERDRKHKAEHAANESRLRSLRRSGLIGVFEWKTDGRITDANNAFLDALGYSSEDLRSGQLTMQGLTPPEYWERDRIALQQVADTGHCSLYEKQAIRKDGSRIDVLVGRSILGGTTDAGIGYAADITDLKTAQAEKAALTEKLAQAEKLNALGKLAGGVAHDFNNLLSVIVGYASLTESRLPHGNSQRNNATQILRAADKAQKLIRKLMAFSRKQVLNPELIDVNSLITELNAMLDRILEKRIQLVLRLDPNVGYIRADSTQIEQVIMNLVVNAQQAMPEGGTLTVETCSVKIPRAETQIQTADEFVMIRITDTGTGIPPEARAHIFEPFFTTRGESGGTGLGLATVYGIVDQSGGRIELDSKVGSGSIFTVYLPRAHGDREAMRKIEPHNSESSHSSGSEEATILLAEDRDDVREMLTLTLESKGYHVIQSANGEEAVKAAKAFHGNIHLMVTDVAMPHLNGPQAVQQIRAFRPGLKVIFVTGYSDQPFTHPKIPSTITLEKPLRPETLYACIRDLLEQSSAVAGQTV